MSKDSFIRGILVGLIAPILSFAAISFTNIQQSFFAEKPLALFVIAGAINLILLRAAYKKGFDNTGKGIILITFLALLAVLYTQKISI